MAIDLRHFRTFDGRWRQARTKKPRLTINPRGVFVMNEPAFQAVGGPPAIEFLYDPTTQRMAIRGTDEKAKTAIPLRRSQGSKTYLAGGRAFLAEVGVQIQSLMVFDDPPADEGVILLDPKDAAIKPKQKRSPRA